MKTAMQELMEWLDDSIPVTIKEQYLEKEKEQMIKAHIDGFDHIVVDFKKQEYAEQYYNETYNSNKS
jgi:hypothetical protein